MERSPSQPAREISNAADERSAAAAEQRFGTFQRVNQVEQERTVLLRWQTATFTRTERVAMDAFLTKHPDRWSDKELETVRAKLLEQLSRGDWDDADKTMDVLDVMSTNQRERVLHGAHNLSETLLRAACSGGGPILAGGGESDGGALASPGGSQQRYQAYLRHRLISAIRRLVALGCRQISEANVSGQTQLDLYYCPALQAAIQEATDADERVNNPAPSTLTTPNHTGRKARGPPTPFPSNLRTLSRASSAPTTPTGQMSNWAKARGEGWYRLGRAALRGHVTPPSPKRAPKAILRQRSSREDPALVGGPRRSSPLGSSQGSPMAERLCGSPRRDGSTPGLLRFQSLPVTGAEQRGIAPLLGARGGGGWLLKSFQEAAFERARSCQD